MSDAFRVPDEVRKHLAERSRQPAPLNLKLSLPAFPGDLQAGRHEAATTAEQGLAQGLPVSEAGEIREWGQPDEESGYRRYALTLTKVAAPERDKFHALSAPHTYYEIKKGEAGNRVAYSVEMTEEEYGRAQDDADDPSVNLIHVEPVRIAFLCSNEETPGVDAMRYHHANRANEIGLTGEGVVIGSVDSGISPRIRDAYFSGRIAAARGFAGYGPYDPPNSHGSEMTPIAIPPKARLAVANAAVAGGVATDAAAAAINWLADDVGVDILYCEFFAPYTVQVIRDAVANAAGKGIMVLAARGNGGDDNVGAGTNGAGSPATDPGVLAISNYNHVSDSLAYTSNFGSVWAAVTGGPDYVTNEDGSFATMDDAGTSGAVALAADLCARMMTGGKSASEVKSRMEALARKTGASSEYEGVGVLQLPRPSRPPDDPPPTPQADPPNPNDPFPDPVPEPPPDPDANVTDPLDKGGDSAGGSYCGMFATYTRSQIEDEAALTRSSDPSTRDEARTAVEQAIEVESGQSLRDFAGPSLYDAVLADGATRAFERRVRDWRVSSELIRKTSAASAASAASIPASMRAEALPDPGASSQMTYAGGVSWNSICKFDPSLRIPNLGGGQIAHTEVFYDNIRFDPFYDYQQDGGQWVICFADFQTGVYQPASAVYQTADDGRWHWIIWQELGRFSIRMDIVDWGAEAGFNQPYSSPVYNYDAFPLISSSDFSSEADAANDLAYVLAHPSPATDYRVPEDSGVVQQVMNVAASGGYSPFTNRQKQIVVTVWGASTEFQGGPDREMDYTATALLAQFRWPNDDSTIGIGNTYVECIDSDGEPPDTFANPPLVPAGGGCTSAMEGPAGCNWTIPPQPQIPMPGDTINDMPITKIHIPNMPPIGCKMPNFGNMDPCGPGSGNAGSNSPLPGGRDRSGKRGNHHGVKTGGKTTQARKKTFDKKTCFTRASCMGTITQLLLEIGVPALDIVFEIGPEWDKTFSRCFEKGTAKFDAAVWIARRIMCTIIDEGPPTNKVYIGPPHHRPGQTTWTFDENYDLFVLGRSYSSEDSYYAVEVFGPRVRRPVLALVDSPFSVDPEQILRIEVGSDYSQKEAEDLAAYRASMLKRSSTSVQVSVPYDERYMLRDKMVVRAPDHGYQETLLIYGKESDISIAGYIHILTGVLPATAAEMDSFPTVVGG